MRHCCNSQYSRRHHHHPLHILLCRNIQYQLTSGHHHHTPSIRTTMAAMPWSLLLLCLCLASSATTTTTAAAGSGFTTFKVYFHDVVRGPNRTAVWIARAPPGNNASAALWGGTVAIDDPLTAGPSRASSAEVGRAQGRYTLADQATVGLLMTMNFVFTAGEHRGSSLAIFGWNYVLLKVREMTIVGGTGKFRMARGYVEARTVDLGAATGDTIVEYTVNVQAHH